MADLIDRAALIHDLIHNRSFYPVCVRRAIEAAPAIEAKPVVHGEWAQVRKGVFGVAVCSNCKCDGFIEYNYCPNCGADMRGET